MPQPMPALFASTSYHFGGLTISSLQILDYQRSGRPHDRSGLPYSENFLRHRHESYFVRCSDRSSDGCAGEPNYLDDFLYRCGSRGAAGVLYGLAYPVIAASMGILVGWKAFVAAVIGGIGKHSRCRPWRISSRRSRSDGGSFFTFHLP